jgi:uncharacterized membrane protein YeiH
MWGLPPGDTVLHVLSLVALAAQAMTAALAAGRRSMDWVGVCLLGCLTALGGGTIRDVVLGHYPLPWVQNPSYLAITAIAAFATVLIAEQCAGSRSPFWCWMRSGLWSSPWPAATSPGK